MNFSGKICVVTGAANGIGRCILEKFCEAGAEAAFVDIDTVGGRALEARLGDKAVFMPGDVADEETLNDFALLTIRRFGRVDYLINNVCNNRRGILSGCSHNDFIHVLKVGLAAPYILAHLFMGDFAMNASIINISSTRAIMSQTDGESYAAAKGGLNSLTHALAVSLAGRVRVNAISPGWIDAGAYQKDPDYIPEYLNADLIQHPVRRIGTPEDVAAMTMFLCSDQAGFITGQNFVVDGGMARQMIYHEDRGWTFEPDNR